MKPRRAREVLSRPSIRIARSPAPRAGQRPGERRAVERAGQLGRRGHARQVEQGRRGVGVDDRCRDPGTRRDSRPANEQRDVDRLLVGAVLAARDPVLACEHPVVGGEHDHRPVELPAALEPLDEVRDRLVERQQGRESAAVVALDPLEVGGAQPRLAHESRLVGDVGLVERRAPRGAGARVSARVARRGDRALLATPRAWRPRRAATARRVVAAETVVGRVIGEPEEERVGIGGVGGDERQRVLAGQGVGLIVGGPGAEVARLAARVEDVEVVERGQALTAGTDQAPPLVPARRRPPGGAQPVQPLAGERGVVAVRLQPGGEVAIRVEQAAVAAAAAGVVALRAVVVRVLAGEQGRARGTAERKAREGVGELGPAIADQAPGPRQRPHHSGPLVVGHHDDDVRPRLLCAGVGGAARGERAKAGQRECAGCHDQAASLSGPCHGRPEASHSDPELQISGTDERCALRTRATEDEAKPRGLALRRLRGASGPRPATAASSATGSRSGGCARA